MAHQPKPPPHPSTSVSAAAAVITFSPGSSLDSLNQTGANSTSTTRSTQATTSGPATATPTSLGKFFGLDMPTWAPIAIAAVIIGLCMVIVCVACRRCLRIVCCFGCPCKCRRRKNRAKRKAKRKGLGSDSSDDSESEDLKTNTRRQNKIKRKGKGSAETGGSQLANRIVYDGSGGAADVEAYLLAHGQLYKVESPVAPPVSQGPSSALSTSNTLRTGAILSGSKSNKHAPKVQSPLAIAPVLRAASTTSMGSTTASVQSHPSLGATMVVQGGQIVESIGFSGQQGPQRIGSGRLLVASASSKSLNKSGRGSQGGTS